MEKVYIELKNIEVSFLDQLVLDIPRLAVHQFDRIGIVGKNGAGKSTLLKLLAGQIAPDKGQVNRFADFAYFDQLSRPVEKEDYELLGKLSIPQTELTLKAGDKILLKEASFQFPLGSIIAITGKNGSGKTTLLRHIIQRGKGLSYLLKLSSVHMSKWTIILKRMKP
jgi:ATPase subunit of ABC transporter with duplicated ATPase domains